MFHKSSYDRSCTQTCRKAVRRDFCWDRAEMGQGFGVEWRHFPPLPQSLITVTNSFSHNSKNLYDADTNFVFAYLFLFPLHQIPFFPYFHLSAYFCFISIRARGIIVLMCAQCRVSRQEAWRSEVFLSINFRNEGSCIKCGTERTDWVCSVLGCLSLRWAQLHGCT